MASALVLIFIDSWMSWAQALSVKVRLKKNISQAELRGLALKDPFRKAVLTLSPHYEKLDVGFLKKIGPYQICKINPKVTPKLLGVELGSPKVPMFDSPIN